jgi:hypothetical protein
MKLMDAQQLIELLPYDGIVVRHIAVELQNSVPGITAESLAEGVKSGKYKATTIKIEGLVSYHLFWHKNLQDILVINAAVALTGKDQFVSLLHAGRMLMREQGCKGIEFCTKRRGLVEKLLKHGGDIVGITCYIE